MRDSKSFHVSLLIPIYCSCRFVDIWQKGLLNNVWINLQSVSEITYEKFFSYIFAISLNFDDNFVFKITATYIKFLFTRTIFYITLQNYHILSVYKHFVSFVFQEEHHVMCSPRWFELFAIIFFKFFCKHKIYEYFDIHIAVELNELYLTV
jgi:hypothetical protein